MNKNIRLAILFIILIALGVILYLRKDNIDNMFVEPGQEEKEDNSLATVNYGLLTNKKIDLLDYIDFNKRIIRDSSVTNNNISFDSKSITYEVVGEVTDTLQIANIKQVALACHCSYCYAIYYLDYDGELYKITLDHGYLSEDDKDTFYSNATLLEKNVLNFDLLDNEIIDVTTCGGYTLVYKDREGNVKIKYDESSKSLDISKFERKWVEGTGYEDGNALYIVSSNVPVKNYLQDENGNNLIVKELYTAYNSYESQVDEPVIKLYILTQDNNLYYFDKPFVNNIKGKLFKNSKVTSIVDDGEDIKILFEDGTEEITAGNLEFK